MCTQQTRLSPCLYVFKNYTHNTYTIPFLMCMHLQTIHMKKVSKTLPLIDKNNYTKLTTFTLFYKKKKLTIVSL